MLDWFWEQIFYKHFSKRSIHIKRTNFYPFFAQIYSDVAVHFCCTGHGQVEEDRLSQEQQIVRSKMKTLIDATENFHDDNKLGEGGFGPVYKVTHTKFLKYYATSYKNQCAAFTSLHSFEGLLSPHYVFMLCYIFLNDIWVSNSFLIWFSMIFSPTKNKIC